MLLIEGNDGKPHWAFWMNVYCVVLCIVSWKYFVLDILVALDEHDLQYSIQWKRKKAKQLKNPNKHTGFFS